MPLTLSPSPSPSGKLGPVHTRMPLSRSLRGIFLLGSCGVPSRAHATGVGRRSGSRPFSASDGCQVRLIRLRRTATTLRGRPGWARHGCEIRRAGRQVARLALFVSGVWDLPAIPRCRRVGRRGRLHVPESTAQEVKVASDRRAKCRLQVAYVVRVDGRIGTLSVCIAPEGRPKEGRRVLHKERLSVLC